jgi:BED zinc finger
MTEKCKRSSFAWDHFDLDENEKKVICKTCKATLAYNIHTSSLTTQMQAEHPWYKILINQAAAAELVTMLVL